MSPTKDSPAQRRRDNWYDGDVRLLLEVWADDHVQADLEGTGRNVTIYQRIADRFEWCAGGEAVAGVSGEIESCHANIKIRQQATSPVWCCHC